ncbi:MAG: glycosyltransferase [Acidobacteriota bacterium]|nr:glycosyltransferase [Acidobacteriota bacterium]
MLKATVIIPTFDHGLMLYESVRSALNQSVSDLEVFIIGDGVPDITRNVVADLMAQDKRVRFFDHPKDSRHGEIYRHQALAEARGEIVCYLADDDLWLPDHIAYLYRLLKQSDFAHSLPFYINADGSIGGVYTIDLALPADREIMLAGFSQIHLASAGHTRKMYERLPYGWRTTPKGIYTDLYMWQRFLEQPACRAVSGMRPTSLTFPSPMRLHQPMEERVAELKAWNAKINDPAWRQGFTLELLEWVARDRAVQVAHLRDRLRFQLDTGKGWYLFETSQGEIFRWVNNDAEVICWLPGTTRQELRLEIEPGPGVNGQPFELQILDEAGEVAATLFVNQREVVKAVLPTMPGRTTIFRLHAPAGGNAIPTDPRILNFRVFKASLFNLTGPA